MKSVVADLAVLRIIEFDSDSGAVSFGQLNLAGDPVDSTGDGNLLRPEDAAMLLLRFADRIEADFRRLFPGGGGIGDGYRRATGRKLPACESVFKTVLKFDFPCGEHASRRQKAQDADETSLHHHSSPLTETYC